MKRELISRVTRNHFREWLVGWTLREIGDLFEGHGFEYFPLPEDELPKGQRRSMVECFHASVDWSDAEDVRRMLRAYEDVLFQMPEAALQYRQELLRYLYKRGWNLRPTTWTLPSVVRTSSAGR